MQLQSKVISLLGTSGIQCIKGLPQDTGQAQQRCGTGTHSWGLPGVGQEHTAGVCLEWGRDSQVGFVWRKEGHTAGVCLDWDSDTQVEFVWSGARTIRVVWSGAGTRRKDLSGVGQGYTGAVGLERDRDTQAGFVWHTGASWCAQAKFSCSF